jgi:aspartokinase
MGALFRSGHITIWTDVDGVYSADPRKVRSGARNAADTVLVCHPAAD